MSGHGSRFTAADQPKFDFVLLNRAKSGGRYHRPIQYSSAVGAACGSGTRDMVRVDEERVAVRRYKREKCGRCYPKA